MWCFHYSYHQFTGGDLDFGNWISWKRKTSLLKQPTYHNFMGLVRVGWLLRVGKVRKSIHHCRKVALSLASESQWPQLALVLQKAGCSEAIVLGCLQQIHVMKITTWLTTSWGSVSAVSVGLRIKSKDKLSVNFRQNDTCSFSHYFSLWIDHLPSET